MDRPKMSRQDRAKQFMPFAALRGLAEAIKEAERETVPRAELYEEEAEVLNRKLRRLRPGLPVRVGYYRGDGYQTLTGAVSNLNASRRELKIGEARIGFDELRELELEKQEG